MNDIRGIAVDFASLDRWVSRCIEQEMAYFRTAETKREKIISCTKAGALRGLIESVRDAAYSTRQHDVLRFL